MFEFSRASHHPIAQWWWTVDKTLFFLILALMVIGLILSFAATPPIALNFNLSPYYFVTRQALFMAMSFVVLITVSFISPRRAIHVSLVLFVIFAILMCVVLVSGPQIKGANRWVYIGGFTLQPSEFIKAPFVILCAHFLTGRFPKLYRYGVALCLYAFCAMLLLLEPDYGQFALLTVAFGAILFVYGVPWRIIFALALVCVAVFFIAYFYVPHVTSRIDSFFGADSSHPSYQVMRAMQSFKSGGLLGRGPGEGIVKKVLPDGHTDFIFSVAAEEYGGLFAALLVLVFGSVVLRSLFDIMREQNLFLRTAVAGLVSFFGTQSLINFAVNVHLIPTKGMTLPFMSYGGSSLLATALLMGMVLALTRRGAFLRMQDNVSRARS